MFTKKDLESKFNVSDNTVYKTLQVCGLDTRKHEYSDEEIEKYFIPARKMLDAGKKYKEVKEYFEMKVGGAAEVEGESEFDSEGFASNETADASDTVSVAVAQTVADMVQKSVREVLPYVPALVAQTINQELNSGEIKEAFNKMRSQVNASQGSGAAFLLQKLRGGQNQLMPASPEYRQLASASPENSEENSPDSSSS